MPKIKTTMTTNVPRLSVNGSSVDEDDRKCPSSPRPTGERTRIFGKRPANHCYQIPNRIGRICQYCGTSESRLVNLRATGSITWHDSVNGRKGVNAIDVDKDKTQIIHVENATLASSLDPGASPTDSMGDGSELVDELDHLDAGRLILQGSPAKPTILSGNALHLRLDDELEDSYFPTTPSTTDQSHTQPLIPKIAPDVKLDDEEPTPSSPRVRFRSRVRIASGLHRHRKHQQRRSSSQDSSSDSDSPCSSISAPLRYQADSNSVLGPLGQRLHAYAAANQGWGTRILMSPGIGSGSGSGSGNGKRRLGAGGGRSAQRVKTKPRMDERTPLVGGSSSGSRPVYLNGHRDGNGSPRDHEDEREENDDNDRAVSVTEHEVVFGKWPWRLFNHKWWWWQLESTIFCGCNDDSDIDD
ncbi:hypothetical protein JAAARDRAFT_196336 [Jaapia argillacea MUCL 33604]|uniref:Uncharacterized protein n=1 Tax=Jaapia argillacea MUCL 33604 TaxID=933084 RepID=A0A067PXA7_9AGAM|nr:hypothetical protein JAAARDRAFT_196336 [Jaapia argillacea MUCL 33604]